MLQLRIHNSCTQMFYFCRSGAQRKTCVIIKKKQIAWADLGIMCHGMVNKREYIVHIF